jgi:hypothetical protein
MSNTNDTPAFAPTDIDNQVSALISEIAAEQAQEVLSPPPSPTAQDPVPAEAPPPEDNTVPHTPDPTDRGLERLVAREVELREREKALSATQQEMEALKARLRELEPRALLPEDIERIKLSPSEGLRKLGLDPDEVVRQALVEKLGDKANDPAMREMLEKTKMRKDMEALRNQVQQAELRQAAQAYYTQVATGARDFTSNVDGLSKHAPTVATVAKSNPDRVYQEIMEEIQRDAAVRSAREPNGDVISYEEAAKRVEARWSAMKSLLGAGVAPQSTPNNAPNAVNDQPKTNVGATQPTKTPPSTIKPPDRPMAPWLQPKLDEEEAIREAMAEWQRVESAKRR